MERFRLDGRVALVTGGSSSLGQAVARALAGAGAPVAVAARRFDRMSALADEIGAHPVAVDLLDPDQVGALVPQVVEALGPPEILVNVAGGMASDARAEDESIADIERTLRLNLVAPFLLSQAVFPHMVAAGRGAVVHVASISGIVGVPSIPQASYAASKAGLSGLTKELAVQWARHRIRVNTVAPGFFRSEITEPLYATEKGREYLRRGTLLPDEGTAEDVVGAILWLVGDAGRHVTGQTITVDGGWTAK